MSITDELREYANTRISPNKGMLTAIADRIDEEHRKAKDEMWLNGYGVYRAQLMEGNEDIESDLEKAGLVKGPLDADGEIWHSFDMSDSNWGVIEGIAYDNGTWYIKGHDTSAPWIRADSVRHYHKTIVEDVLREMAVDWDCAADGEDKESVLREYASKFRLAGDGDEQ